MVVPSPPAKGAGLFGFVSNNCGPSGATDEFPNGAQWFLNCGLTSSDTSSGWVCLNYPLSSFLTLLTQRAIDSASRYHDGSAEGLDN